jgi:hypothetical protein
LQSLRAAEAACGVASDGRIDKRDEVCQILCAVRVQARHLLMLGSKYLLAREDCRGMQLAQETMLSLQNFLSMSSRAALARILDTGIAGLESFGLPADQEDEEGPAASASEALQGRFGSSATE